MLEASEECDCFWKEKKQNISVNELPLSYTSPQAIVGIVNLSTHSVQNHTSIVDLLSALTESSAISMAERLSYSPFTTC